MCYAFSSPFERDYTLEEIETRLDQLIAVEGKGISLQISGGAFRLRFDSTSLRRRAGNRRSGWRAACSSCGICARSTRSALRRNNCSASTWIFARAER
jgi:hypothetical protein